MNVETITEILNTMVGASNQPPVSTLTSNSNTSHVNNGYIDSIQNNRNTQTQQNNLAKDILSICSTKVNTSMPFNQSIASQTTTAALISNLNDTGVSVRVNIVEKKNAAATLPANIQNLDSFISTATIAASTATTTTASTIPPATALPTQNHRSIITSSQLKCAQDEKPKPLVASPKQAMVLYMNKLTPYEHHEIFKYPQIYFIGANAKKRPGIIGPNNSDYDNEQGSYIHIPHDHVAYRYEVLKIIGKGSFGQVVKAYDHKTHEHVALKMVRNEKRFHRQAQEEIRILSHLRKHDKDNSMNIIHMYDYFTFRNHMCITFELLYINLYELIKKNKFQGFSLQLVRKFAHSLLQCLDALAKNKIIHCDMKPENVLLKQQGRSGIKVNMSTLYVILFKF